MDDYKPQQRSSFIPAFISSFSNNFNQNITQMKPKARPIINRDRIAHDMNTKSFNFGDESEMCFLRETVKKERDIQDEVLDDMESVLERLNVKSNDIQNEIIDQSGIIKDADNIMAETQSRMERIDKKMNTLLRKSGLNTCTWIAILVCIIVFLLFLIFQD